MAGQYTALFQSRCYWLRAVMGVRRFPMPCQAMPRAIRPTQWRARRPRSSAPASGGSRVGSGQTSSRGGWWKRGLSDCVDLARGRASGPRDATAAGILPELGDPLPQGQQNRSGCHRSYPGLPVREALMQSAPFVSVIGPDKVEPAQDHKAAAGGQDGRDEH